MSRLLTFTTILLLFITSCSVDFSPKPMGYPRIDFPERTYLKYDTDCPFTFVYPAYCIISKAGENSNPCWFNIDYPFLNSRIHMSYKALNGDLESFVEDSRTLVYKHTVKANAIRQRDISDQEHRIYAKFYEIDGDVASSIQFYISDSSNYFLRGALYFNANANADSLEPAVEYISEDIIKLIQSLRWKYLNLKTD